jgi:DtxR family Mn-dependent transcriptional regulator
MDLTSREEDYLETIYLLSPDNRPVSITEVARELDVTLPTVNSAVSKLKEYGLVYQEHYGKIILNEDGRRIGAGIYRAHRAIRIFLTNILHLPHDIAENEACQMEHAISRETMHRLEILVEKMQSSKLGRIDYDAIKSSRK